MPRAVDVPPPSSNDLKALQRAVQLLNAQVRALQQQIDAILRRLGVVILIVALSSACTAQTDTPTLTPTATPSITPTVTATGTVTATATVAPCITFRVGLSDPNTNPPSQAWGKDVVHKINAKIFASQCGSSSGGGAAGSGCGTDAAVCADSGNGDRGAVTIAPNCGPPCCNVELTVNDADGCEVTVDETGAVDGSVAYIVNTSANPARVADQAGVLDIPHDVSYFFGGETLVLKYDNAQWYQVGSNEPSSNALTLIDITSFADVPPIFGPVTECWLICSSTFVGQDADFTTPGGCQVFCPTFVKNIQMREDTCECFDNNGAINIGDPASTGTDSTCIGDGVTCGNDAVGIGDNGTVGGSGVGVGPDVDVGTEGVGIGPRAKTGTRGYAIGTDSEAGDQGFAMGTMTKATGAAAMSFGSTNANCDVSGVESFHIGQKNDCDGGDLIGTESFILGTAPFSMDGDFAQCFGFLVECDADHGICWGDFCHNQEQDVTWGSSHTPLHPVWAGDPDNLPTLSSCGSGPAITDPNSNDVTGTITVGTGVSVTSCTLTFARQWAQEPNCDAMDKSQILFIQTIETTTTLTLNAALSFAGDEIKYKCPVSAEEALPTRTATATPTATP